MTAEAINIDTVEAISVIQRDSYTSIVISDGEKVSELEKCFINIVERPTNILINCTYIEELTPYFITALKALETQITSQNKKFIFIFVNEKLKNQFLNNKESEEFDIATSLLNALEAIHLDINDAHPDISFIKSFVNSTVKTIFVQAKTLAKRKNLSMVKTDQNKLDGEISGVVNIEDSVNPYVIIVSFEEATFIELISRMTGEKYTELTDEIKDGAKELMNIIYGQANSISTVKQDKMAKPPSLILGDKFPGEESPPEVTTLTNTFETGVTLAIQFTSMVGDFNLRIWFPNEQVAQALISA